MKSCQCIELHSGPGQVFFFCEKCFQNKVLSFFTSAGWRGEAGEGGGFLGTFFLAGGGRGRWGMKILWTFRGGGYENYLDVEGGGGGLRKFFGR